MRLSGWALPFLLVVLLITMPIWIPAGIVLSAVCRRRLRKAAEGFLCVQCGKVLGAAALKLADEVWAAHWLELQRKYPGARLRMVRTIHAVCPACGTQYEFLERERTFVVNAEQRV